MSAEQRKQMRSAVAIVLATDLTQNYKVVSAYQPLTLTLTLTLT